MGAWHVSFCLETCATFCAHEVSFQLLEDLSTAMACLFVEVRVHLSIMYVYVSLPSGGERTGGAGPQLPSVTVFHVHPQHLHLRRTQRALLLCLLVVQPLVHSQLNLGKHLRTDVTLGCAMGLHVLCPGHRVVKLLRTVVTGHRLTMVHNPVLHQTGFPLEVGSGADAARKWLLIAPLVFLILTLSFIILRPVAQLVLLVCWLLLECLFALLTAVNSPVVSHLLALL